jgi:hypothetical protein
VSIDRKTAMELASLYSRRQQLQQHKERASDKNMWIGVLQRGAVVPAERSGAVRASSEAEQVIDATGGLGVVSTLLKQAVCEQLEAEMKRLDAQISGLGGEV